MIDLIIGLIITTCIMMFSVNDIITNSPFIVDNTMQSQIRSILPLIGVIFPPLIFMGIFGNQL